MMDITLYRGITACRRTDGEQSPHVRIFPFELYGVVGGGTGAAAMHDAAQLCSSAYPKLPHVRPCVDAHAVLAAHAMQC